LRNTILVTGGLGYIGSHTIVELLNLDYNVICIDDLSNSKIEVKSNIERITNKSFDFFNIDVSNEELLNEVFESYDSIDGVIHFAAFKAVGESVSNPLKYYRNNLDSLLSVLNCTEKYNSNFVFSSSCTVYGEPSVLPISEDVPVAIPTSPYGNTKKVGEEILKDYSKTSDRKIVSLRYFNPVGAHSSGLIGELSNNIPQNLFPYLMQTATGKRDKLIIHGSDYDTPDGTCIRDYIHVIDLANAHIRALEYMYDTAQGYSVFNIGTGIGFSVLQVVNRFVELTGVKLNFEFGPRRNGDIVKIWASSDFAIKHLNWKSKLNLDEMIISSWEWEKIIVKNEK
jgi:UDP-glucose 4-epimerase